MSKLQRGSAVVFRDLVRRAVVGAVLVVGDAVGVRLAGADRDHDGCDGADQVRSSYTLMRSLPLLPEETWKDGGRP
ncbi:hypothetical protein GW17_00019419 [Ensete ventricosum]|nr:hypothetical protein GW17_00019419 [Ensete ventricosum]RZR78276.1 hypothetical protein BHM03_00003545 [Ensete ventricosum]